MKTTSDTAELHEIKKARFLWNFLCLPGEPSSPPAHYCLKNVQEVKDFLGRHAEKLDKLIAAFCHSFKEQERKGLRHYIVRNWAHFLSLLHNAGTA